MRGRGRGTIYKFALVVRLIAVQNNNYFWFHILIALRIIYTYLLIQKLYVSFYCIILKNISINTISQYFTSIKGNDIQEILGTYNTFLWAVGYKIKTPNTVAIEINTKISCSKFRLLYETSM